MGMYEHRVTRRGRSGHHAIRVAKERAYRKGIHLYWDPVVEKKRVPVPLIGPKTHDIVRFEPERGIEPLTSSLPWRHSAD
jgi:hypothetical protein